MVNGWFSCHREGTTEATQDAQGLQRRLSSLPWNTTRGDLGRERLQGGPHRPVAGDVQPDGSRRRHRADEGVHALLVESRPAKTKPSRSRRRHGLGHLDEVVDDG